MKNILKLSAIYGLLLTGIACSESDLIIDEIFNSVDTTSGVVMRVIDEPTDFLTNVDTTPNNEIDSETLTYSVEIQRGNGTLDPELKELRLYISFFYDNKKENPLLDDQGAEVGELLLNIDPASDFAIGPNGVPRVSTAIPVSKFLEILPANAALGPIQYLTLRFEFETLDGRSYQGTPEEYTLEVTLRNGYFNAKHVFSSVWINNS